MSLTGRCVLVTGGAGYIGSHACVELLESGCNVITIDSLVNSNLEAIDRIEKITGKSIRFVKGDLRDSSTLEHILKNNTIDDVIHFAGYKAVGESVENPLLYYSNNVAATIVLLNMMEKYQVENIVFSSSCTVYGDPEQVPVSESAKLEPTNPYGRSKLMVEKILQDNFKANGNLSVSILRYFNPIGAHPSGKIGEDPKGIPNNLLPYISKVATGELDKLQVFGGDYNTHDGTGVRDYIHVVDLVKAHISALKELIGKKNICDIYNLGTGQGYSVLDVVNAFEEVSKKKVSYEIVQRRIGDVDKTFANPQKANNKLDWKAEKGLEEMCKDMWNWQQENPNGYKN